MRPIRRTDWAGPQRDVLKWWQILKPAHWRAKSGKVWLSSSLLGRAVTTFSGTLMFLWRRRKESLLRFTRIVWDRQSSSAPTVPPLVRLASPRTVPTMSKPGAKKSHWTSRVNECAVIKDARGELNVSLRGGAEHGEFAVIGPVNDNLVIYKHGRLNEGELLLEVENLSISGLPLYDVESVIRNCKGPVRLKTVRPGKWWWTPNFVPFFFLPFLLFLNFKGDLTHFSFASNHLFTQYLIRLTENVKLISKNELLKNKSCISTSNTKVRQWINEAGLVVLIEKVVLYYTDSLS